MPEGSAAWALACSEYGERFVCAVRHGNCVATQFHPEKSGTAALVDFTGNHGPMLSKMGYTMLHMVIRCL